MQITVRYPDHGRILAILGTISNLSATPGDTTVSLSWTPAANATSHQPQYRVLGSGTWIDFGSPLGAGAASVVITGLTNDTEYEVRIIASDGSTTTTSNVDTATPEEAAMTLDWFADFRTALGNDDNALLDGGKLTGYVSDPVRSLGGIISASGLGFPTGMDNVFQYEIPNANTAIQPRVVNQWPLPTVGSYLFERFYIMCDFPPGHSPNDQHFYHLGRNGGSYESTFWLNGIEGGSPPGSVGSGGEYRIQFMPNWQSSTTSEVAWQNIYLVSQEVYRIELRTYRPTTTGIRFTLRVYDSAGNLRNSSPSQVWFEYYGSQGWADLPDFELTIGDPESMLRTREIGYNGSGPTGVFSPTPYVHLGGLAVRVTDDPDRWIGGHPVTGAED